MSLSLSDIYYQGHDWIREILSSNGMNVTPDDTTNLLNAARLVRQAGQLTQEDSLLIDNPIMEQLLRQTKVELAKQIINNMSSQSHSISKVANDYVSRSSIHSQDTSMLQTVDQLPLKASSDLSMYSVKQNPDDIYVCGKKTYQLRQDIKSIPNAKWDKTVGCWKFPSTSFKYVNDFILQNSNDTKQNPALSPTSISSSNDLVVTQSTKPDVFSMTDIKLQKYYNMDYILPYVGFRFLVARAIYRNSGAGLFDNYVVLNVGKKEGKLIKSAVVSKCKMDGSILIGSPRNINIDTKNKRWVWSDPIGKNKGFAITKGIASDEGIIVSSYDDPLMKYITNHKFDHNDVPIPELNLVVTVFKIYMYSSFVQRYYVSEISGDMVKLTVVPVSDSNSVALKWPRGLSSLPTDNTLDVKITRDGWHALYDASKELHNDQFYQYELSVGSFRVPEYDQLNI